MGHKVLLVDIKGQYLDNDSHLLLLTLLFPGQSREPPLDDSMLQTPLHLQKFFSFVAPYYQNSLPHVVNLQIEIFEYNKNVKVPRRLCPLHLQYHVVVDSLTPLHEKEPVHQKLRLYDQTGERRLPV